MAIPLPQIFGTNTTAKVESRGFSEKPVFNPVTKKMLPHPAIDLAAQEGTPIHALASGRVKKVGYDPISGYYLQIDHGDGYITKHAHLKEKPSFSVGQSIENGQVVARVGSTGRSTGPHLHLGLQKDGKAIDPTKIQDLETYIRPVVARTETTESIQPRELLKTNNVVEPTTSNIENKNTVMASQPKTSSTAGGTFQKKGQAKVYATTGDMASDILGKGIGNLTAGEIMTMAMNQGLSRRDAQRAARGLEKFQSLGGNAEMVFDPNSNRYNVLFKNGDNVEVDPRQGRRLGGNAKVGAADLIGLGRDVNYLAEVVSRSRKKAEEPAKKESTESPKASNEPEEAGTMSRPEMEVDYDYLSKMFPMPEGSTDTEGFQMPDFEPEQISEEEANRMTEAEFLGYVRRRANEDLGKYEGKSFFQRLLEGTPIISDEISPIKTQMEISDVVIPTAQKAIKSTKEGLPTTTKASDMWYGKGKGPQMYAKVDLKDPSTWEKSYQEILNQNRKVGDPGVGMGMFSPSASVPLLSNAWAKVANKFPSLTTKYGVGRGAEFNKRYTTYATQLLRPKSTLPPRSPLPPRSAWTPPPPPSSSWTAPGASSSWRPALPARTTKALPASPAQRALPPSKTPKLLTEGTKYPIGTIGGKMGVVRQASSKYADEIAKAVKSNPNSKSLVLKDGTRVRLKKGNWEAYKDGGKMSLPKYVDGNKFTAADLMSGQTALNLESKSDDSTLLDTVTVTAPRMQSKLTGYDIKPVASLGKLPGLSLGKKPVATAVTGTGNPQAEIYGKGLNPDKPKFGLSDFQSVAKYAAPLTEIAAAKYLKKNIQKVPYTPIQARTGVVRDIPGRPSPVMRNVANRGSDLLTSGLVDLQGSAMNRAAENQYNIANQQSRIAQEQQIMDRENQLAMMNARMKMATDQQNVQTANAVTGQMANAIRNVGLATQGNLANDAAQRAMLGGTREANLLGLMAEQPELFSQEQKEKMFNSVGLAIQKPKGKKGLKFKISK